MTLPVLTLPALTLWGLAVGALTTIWGPTLAPWNDVPAATLSAPASEMVFLPRAVVHIGSTRPEVVRAAARCNRDAGSQACTLDDFADELDGPTLTVEPFWLDRQEVSLGQYTSCVEQGRCRPLSYAEGALRLRRPELPAVFVTFQDAAAFCAFRGARLPTEVEFERAARGPSARRYPWGNRFHSALANHGRWGVSRTETRDGYEELAPTDSFENGRTPQGILNLAGNVAEWTSSVYAPYGSAGANPAGADQVVRGGHYLSAPAWLRGSARLHEPRHRRAAYLGFRCARSDV